MIYRSEYTILILIALAILFFAIIAARIKRKYAPVDIYDDTVMQKILSVSAYYSVCRDLEHNEIYTQKGDIRATVRKKITNKYNQYQMCIRGYWPLFVKELKKQGLVADHTMKKKDILVAAEVFEYMYQSGKFVSDKSFKNHGITPEQFFNLRNTVKGDCVGVYIIYNRSRKMYYVGQATRLYFRVNQHFTGHGNGDVYADYKYGDKFTIRLIKLVDSGYEDLDKLEKDMIDKFNAYELGYNKTKGNG